ncbi:hypothetical protein BRC91_00760 [Halobacteriales archaeon QS_4_62_28]|nr:MAG: hypothetical protein BRC91_00760 [Halobacteriales archaeon QS_4_62_28]
MSRQPETPTRGGDDCVKSSILGDLRQRRILSILADQSTPTPVRELGVRLAARETGIAPSEIPESEYQSVRTDLEHRCLLKLESVGWLERYPEGIVATEPFPTETAKLSLPDVRDPEAIHWDQISVLLGCPRRQEVVSLLADQQHRITVNELAGELRNRNHSSRTTYSQADKGSLVTLHHVDLPKLAAVELLSYDAEEKTITRTPRLVSVVNLVGLDNG